MHFPATRPSRERRARYDPVTAPGLCRFVKVPRVGFVNLCSVSTRGDAGKVDERSAGYVDETDGRGERRSKCRRGRASGQLARGRPVVNA